MIEFLALAQQCAPAVAASTLAAIVRVESGFNPFAIGVVGGQLERQPRNKAEAVATAKALHEGGWNFSIGAAQVNRHNLARMNLNYETAVDLCSNLRAGAQILQECFDRARGRGSEEQSAVRQALSCYYAGNFTRGFQADKPGGTSYVQRVVANANVVAQAQGGAADRPTLNPAVLERAVARSESQPAAPVPPTTPAVPPVATAPVSTAPPAAAAVPAAAEKKADAGPVPLRVVPAIAVRASTPAPKAPSASAATPERQAGDADQPRSAAIVF